MIMNIFYCLLFKNTFTKKQRYVYLIFSGRAILTEHKTPKSNPRPGRGATNFSFFEHYGFANEISSRLDKLKWDEKKVTNEIRTGAAAYWSKKHSPNALPIGL